MQRPRTWTKNSAVAGTAIGLVTGLLDFSRDPRPIDPLATLAGAARQASYTAGVRVRMLRRRVRDRRLIDRYVQRNGVRKLQIGTGSNPLPDWLNTDLL